MLQKDAGDPEHLFNSIPVMLLVVDEEYRIRKANKLSACFTGQPEHTLKEHRIGKALHCVHHTDDPKGCGYGPFCEQCTIRLTIEKTLDNGRKYHKTETHLLMHRHGKDQEVTFLLSTADISPSSSAEGSLVVAALEDITEKDRLLRSYQHLFEQTKQLLIETNHRIKNNLANVEALAHIELTSGEKTKEEAIHDIISRIQAVGLVHELLYNNRDYTSIAIDTYIRSLCEALFKSWELPHNAYTFHYELSSLHLPAKEATTIGIITAELLTNSFKYAHTPEGCHISIALSKNNNRIRYSYRDSAGKLPQKVKSIEDLHTGTGLTLIQELVAGLDGTIELDTATGTEFIISFPLN
jgi:two-component sensor histidine kinase